MFLDADVEVTDTWLSALRELLSFDDRVERALRGDEYHITSEASWIERYWFLPIRERKAKTYINGGNIIITRSHFQALGGFSFDLTTGEDVDLCRRVTSTGGRVIHDTRLKVIHHGFPRSVSTFVAREAWHGMGDVENYHMFLRSKVAMASLVYILSHAAIFFGVFSWSAVPAYLGLAVLVVLVGAFGARQVGFKAFCRAPFRTISISYLYFLGRAFSLTRVLVSRNRRDCSSMS